MNIEFYTKVVATLTDELRSIAQSLHDVHGKTDHTTKDHLYDLVTESDVAVENRLTALLQKLDPKTPVVGEEAGGDASVEKYWLIDPIDGTIHFVRGIPFCTAMMVLIINKQPVVSIIYNYSTDECYSAIRGHGAFVNGEPLHTSTRPSEQAMILTEINHKSDSNNAIYRDLAMRFKLLNTVSAGYEFSLVASGKAEARISLDPYGKMYDFAPGALLIQEAGGIVRNFQGEDYSVDDSDFIAAGSVEVYQALLDLVKIHKEI
jgi:myo-inositol-1(or 4)-monophosphatase